MSGIIGQALVGTGIGYFAVFPAGAIGFAIGHFAAHWAIERAYERKCNSLQA